LGLNPLDSVIDNLEEPLYWTCNGLLEAYSISLQQITLPNQAISLHLIIRLSRNSLYIYLGHALLRISNPIIPISRGIKKKYRVSKGKCHD